MNQTILQQKQELVQTIADQIRNAGSTVVVEYRGLTVAEINELRRLLREEGCEMVVYKNSMTRRAVDILGYNELDEALKGPNAITVSKDEIAAARVLAKFAKKHEKLVVKAGIVENKVVNADELKALSALPNKEGMLSMLLSCLQSPISSFARAVKAIADGQSAPSEAPAEEPSAN